MPADSSHLLANDIEASQSLAGWSPGMQSLSTVSRPQLLACQTEKAHNQGGPRGAPVDLPAQATTPSMNGQGPGQPQCCTSTADGSTAIAYHWRSTCCGASRRR